MNVTNNKIIYKISCFFLVTKEYKFLAVIGVGISQKSKVNSSKNLSRSLFTNNSLNDSISDLHFARQAIFLTFVNLIKSVSLPFASSAHHESHVLDGHVRLDLDDVSNRIRLVSYFY